MKALKILQTVNIYWFTVLGLYGTRFSYNDVNLSTTLNPSSTEQQVKDPLMQHQIFTEFNSQWAKYYRLPQTKDGHISLWWLATGMRQMGCIEASVNVWMNEYDALSKLGEMHCQYLFNRLETEVRVFQTTNFLFRRSSTLCFDPQLINL